MAKVKTQAAIYINGEQVKNTYNGIGKAVRILRQDLKNLEIGTKEFQQKSEQLKKAEKRFAKIKNEVTATGRALQQTGGFFSRFTAKLGRFGGFGNLLQLGGLFSIGKTVKDLLEISDAITNVQS